MRKIEMKEIEIDGEVYPYYCDLFVLSKIQDKMSLNEFERQIIGAVVVYDDDGIPLHDKEGRIQLKFDHYDIETLIWGLTLMINEGLEIRGDESGQQIEKVTEAYIGRRIMMSPNELSDMVHDEFNRCFVVKKNTTPAEKQTKRKTQK